MHQDVAASPTVSRSGRSGPRKLGNFHKLSSSYAIDYAHVGAAMARAVMMFIGPACRQTHRCNGYQVFLRSCGPRSPAPPRAHFAAVDCSRCELSRQRTSSYKTGGLRHRGYPTQLPFALHFLHHSLSSHLLHLSALTIMLRLSVLLATTAAAFNSVKGATVNVTARDNRSLYVYNKYAPVF
jgi:hypothetical protein